MEHFALGHWLLVLAYLTSVVGCALGLACAVQARHAADPRHRLRWLVLAAISIGGVGIWLMHFVAMLGFSTPGMPVRYDIFRTVLSAILSVTAVFAGLLVVGGRAKFGWWRLALGGVITGLAVNVMHYTGMAAVRMTMDMNAPDPAGAEVFSFLFPVFVLGAIAMAVPLCAVLMAPARGGVPREPAISPPYRLHSSEHALAADQSVVDGGVPGGTFTGT